MEDQRNWTDVIQTYSTPPTPSREGGMGTVTANGDRRWTTKENAVAGAALRFRFPQLRFWPTTVGLGVASHGQPLTARSGEVEGVALAPAG